MEIGANTIHTYSVVEATEEYHLESEPTWCERDYLFQFKLQRVLK